MGTQWIENDHILVFTWRSIKTPPQPLKAQSKLTTHKIQIKFLLFSMHRSIIHQNIQKKKKSKRLVFRCSLTKATRDREFQSQTPQSSVFYQQCSLLSQGESNPFPKGRRESVQDTVKQPCINSPKRERSVK